MAALTLPFIFGFVSGEAAPIVNQPFEDSADGPKSEPTADVPKAEPADVPKTEPVDVPKAEPADVPKVEPVDAPKAEPADVPKTEPVDVPKAEPADAPKVETATEKATPATVEPTPQPEPYRSQLDSELFEYFKQFDGKTIVDVEFEGASSETLPTVKVAVLHFGESLIKREHVSLGGVF